MNQYPPILHLSNDEYTLPGALFATDPECCKLCAGAKWYLVEVKRIGNGLSQRVGSSQASSPRRSCLDDHGTAIGFCSANDCSHKRWCFYHGLCPPDRPELYSASSFDHVWFPPRQSLAPSFQYAISLDDTKICRRRTWLAFIFIILSGLGCGRQSCSFLSSVIWSSGVGFVPGSVWRNLWNARINVRSSQSNGEQSSVNVNIQKHDLADNIRVNDTWDLQCRPRWRVHWRRTGRIYFWSALWE